MKIAITGTTSGIGCALVHELEHNNEIWQINRPEYDLLDDRALHSIDLTGYDVLINNAGADYKREEFISQKYKHWQNTVKINLLVPMYLTQKFIQQNTKGIVINLTSTGAIKLPTTDSTVFYRSSKIALKHFTREINDIHEKFRIVDIEPGKTETKFTENAGSEKGLSRARLQPTHIVNAVKYAINSPYVTDIRVKC